MSISKQEAVFGSGQYRYRVVEGWANWPATWRLGDVAAVGVDRQDNVYAFHRGENPVVVFDRDGNYVRSWGEGIFKRAHGVHMGPDDTIYLTDDGDHTVRKCTLDGKVLLTLGVPGTAGDYMSGTPFNRCTHTALAPGGDIYVSDGYGNACVHKYSQDGRRLMSWGSPGSGPGEFNLPHAIACDDDGWVYVADRENNRIQVFDHNGRYETQWNNLHRPSGMYMPPGKCPVCYVGEISPYYAYSRDAPNLGPRISILSNEGNLISRIGVTPAFGQGTGQFISPHGLAVDSSNALYVAEVSYTVMSILQSEKQAAPLRTLQKFERVNSHEE